MLHEKVTTLTGSEVLARAKTFFAERVPHFGAFPDEEGSTWATFRGQGGEEIALAVFAEEKGTRVRASSLLFGQTVDRFLSTLPVVDQGAA